MTDGLTEKQRMLLGYMRDYLAEHGTSATVREIAAAFEITSTNGVICHLKALEKKGYVVHYPDGGRWVPRERSIFADCPHCGKELEVLETYGDMT